MNKSYIDQETKMLLTNVINYYGSDDWQIKAFAKICKEFCTYEIDKPKQIITFNLDTLEQRVKYEHAFNNFNWND
jgi:hypothetical protein